MANPEHLAKLKEGVAAWNQWRKGKPFVAPAVVDLSDADLRSANLREADLSNANLSDADLSNATLSKADLSAANLTGANLHRANLNEASLRHAALRGADLISADLSGADLNWAVLSGANLMRSNLSKADLSWADFSGSDVYQLSGADLREANLNLANLSGANLSSANLNGANVTQASLVETNLEDADLTGCGVYGISVWNARLDGAKQSNLLITPEEEPAIRVDNLEVAQFVYLLLNNKKIRDVIDTIGKKAVLILGRFTPERKTVLDGIREALRHFGFLPILFDFEKPSTRDTQETIVTLAGLARFIIADITDPKSIPQEVASIVPTLPSVPVQPLLQAGYEPWGMYDHIKRFPWVLPLVEYENQQALLRELEPKVIVPAEAKAKEQVAQSHRK